MTTLISCSKEKINNRNLKGCWIHSHEENYETYRPCNYKEYPESRFRFTFDLMKNNKCEYLFLAPDDTHYMEEGTWNLDKENNILELNNEKYKITHFESDLLMLEKL